MTGSPRDKEALEAGRLGFSHWAGPSVPGLLDVSQRMEWGIEVDILAKGSEFPQCGKIYTVLGKSCE